MSSPSSPLSPSSRLSEAEEAPGIVRAYHYRCRSAVRAARHCPRQDLLAVATEDDRLVLLRLGHKSKTVQKLFTIGGDSGERRGKGSSTFLSSSSAAASASSSSSIESPITALAWRPDGKTLALGHEDGAFSVYHIEAKSKVRVPKASKPHSDRVTCLYWTDCAEIDAAEDRQRHNGKMGVMTDDENFMYDGDLAIYFNEYINETSSDSGLREARLNVRQFGLGPSEEGRIRRINAAPALPPSLSSSADGASSGGAGGSGFMSGFRSGGGNFQGNKAGPGLSHDVNQPLTVLASGDSAGVVTLSAYGFFPIGCVDLSGAFSPGVGEDYAAFGNPTVCNISLTSDISILTVTLRSRIEDRSSASKSELQEGSSLFRYHVTTVKTDLLWERRWEISEVALHFGVIGELIEHMSASLKRMEQRWDESVRGVRTKFESLRKVLSTHDRVPAPRAELLMLLLTGVPSDALSQWFGSELSPQKVIRLHRSLDSACVAIDCLYTEHFHVALEGLLYRLAELRGLSRWRKYFRSIGVNLQVMQELVQCASSLLITAEDFMVDVREARADFGDLFTWLHGCASVINCVEPELNASARRKGLRSMRRFYDNERLISLLRPSIDEELMTKEGRSTLSAMWQDSVTYSSASSKLIAETLSKEAELDIDVLLHANISKHFSKRNRNNRAKSGPSFKGNAPLPIVKEAPYATSLKDAALASVPMGKDSASLVQQFERLVKKLQIAMRQPSEIISASFVPKANISVFSLTNVAVKSSARSGADAAAPVVPNCKMSLFTKTLPGGPVQHSLEPLRRRRRRAGLPPVQQRFVAFAGHEARGLQGKPRDCVWIMQSPFVANGDSGDEVVPDKSRGKRSREETDDNSTVSGNIKPENMWSLSCVPLPPGKTVISLGFYGEDNADEDDELHLVLLLSSSESDQTHDGCAELVLLALEEDEGEDDDENESSGGKNPIPSVQIGIDLSLGLPSSATLVSLANKAGLVRKDDLFERLVYKRQILSGASPDSLDVCPDRQTLTVCTDESTLHLFRPEESEDEDEEEDEEGDEGEEE